MLETLERYGSEYAADREFDELEDDLDDREFEPDPDMEFGPSIESSPPSRLLAELAAEVGNLADTAAGLEALAGRAVQQGEIPGEDLFFGKIVHGVGKLARSARKTASKVAGTVGKTTLKIASTNPVVATQVALGRSLIRGDSLSKAAGIAVKAGVRSAKQSARFASMVAPMIPGVGTGAAAALAAANALAHGKPISQAAIAAARNAIPGGALARTAFDAGVRIARGKSVSAAAIDAVRKRIPGGVAGQAAFDAAVAISRGRSLQRAVFKGAGRVIQASPYAAGVGEFMRSVRKGANLQKAALSRAGQQVLRNANRQGLSVIRAAQGRAYRRSGMRGSAGLHRRAGPGYRARPSSVYAECRRQLAAERRRARALRRALVSARRSTSSGWITNRRS